MSDKLFFYKSRKSFHEVSYSPLQPFVIWYFFLSDHSIQMKMEKVVVKRLIFTPVCSWETRFSLSYNLHS